MTEEERGITLGRGTIQLKFGDRQIEEWAEWDWDVGGTEWAGRLAIPRVAIETFNDSRRDGNGIASGLASHSRR